MRNVGISTDDRARLRQACDEALPRECCGFLLGRTGGDRLIVERVLVTLNSASAAFAFSIPDHEMRRVRLLSTAWRLAIVALFHSHPAGFNDLSDEDRLGAARSEWPWVIVTPAAAAHDVLITCYDLRPAPK